MEQAGIVSTRSGHYPLNCQINTYYETVRFKFKLNRTELPECLLWLDLTPRANVII